MSYTTRSPHALSGVTNVATAALSVVQDPCLFEVSKLVTQLRDMEKKRPAVPGAPTQPGIGLCKAVGPLKGVLYIKKRPWMIPLAGVAFVTGLVGLGYVLGRTHRR